MPQQLSFDLPAIAARGRDDFFVSTANAVAVALIEGWRDWPARKLVLCGPEGAGKTHLAHVWADLSAARILSADALATADIAQLATGNVVIEDADCIAGQDAAETAFFHLHNLTLAEGHSLLITARAAPSAWALALPDLASRMQGTPTCVMEEPDDALLAAVMMKQFSDRQIMPSAGTIPYLSKRISRTFRAARQTVEALDAASLSTGRPVNRALAAQLLDKSQA
ncbi:chromosomal replication initiator DnaA [Pseudohalocynthiibacter aestuariivivens]|uniref:DnaA/Hda family protein n=1 Tax=Roseovarius pelagicus TaxID=2980108 RepID=A0ABY6DD40_9RHOB|nr:MULTISPECIES: DnaA/Hda family protein [Rhodobacterales]QIE47365.1 chromosomal replication initiator DnaA [Pseudohalocynthiibacter aestuariivivens]UXX84072.1 DnaA/Hda family protein [Roseovarius pelagicus]